PLQWGRGHRPRKALRDLRAGGVEPALQWGRGHRPRKAAPYTSTFPYESGFNGAAVIDRGKPSARCRASRSFRCFNGAAVIDRGKLETEARETATALASMGPRSSTAESSGN